MSAKEMFESLDYEWKEDKNCIQYTRVYYKHWLFKSKRTICFWKYFNGISLNEKYIIDLSLEELQAINKQVEELGWNER